MITKLDVQTVTFWTYWLTSVSLLNQSTDLPGFVYLLFSPLFHSNIRFYTLFINTWDQEKTKIKSVKWRSETFSVQDVS